jgi:hypothetical protein
MKRCYNWIDQLLFCKIFEVDCSKDPHEQFVVHFSDESWQWNSCILSNVCSLRKTWYWKLEFVWTKCFLIVSEFTACTFVSGTVKIVSMYIYIIWNLWMYNLLHGLRLVFLFLFRFSSWIGTLLWISLDWIGMIWSRKLDFIAQHLWCGA